MKFINTAFIALALGAVTTSCLDDGENTISGKDIYATGFNVIVDRQTGDVKYGINPQYEINWKQDGSKERVVLKFSNLGLPEMPDYTYEFAETGVLTTAYDQQISLATAVPVNQTSVTFTNLKFNYIRRVIRDSSLSNQMVNRYVYAISYTVNNRYDVTVYPKTAFCFSKTTVTNLSDPTKPFTTDDYSVAPSYTISFSPVGETCSISISQAKFIENMPALNMMFEGISFTADNKEIKMTAAAITPKIGGDPFPGFPITNLSGTFQSMTTGHLGFECTPATVNNGQTTFQVSVNLDEFPKNMQQPK